MGDILLLLLLEKWSLSVSLRETHFPKILEQAGQAPLIFNMYIVYSNTFTNLPSVIPF